MMQPLFELATSVDALTTQLERYLRSHADDTRKLLKLPAGMPLRVAISGGCAPLETQCEAGTATLHIGEEDAQRVMAYTRSCNWANGIVLVPTLTRLALAGAFKGMRAGDRRSMRAFAASRAADPTRNLGLLWGALNLLALAGWVTLTSGDEFAEYSLTPIGTCIVECVEARQALFRRLADATSWLQHLHALCHRKRISSTETRLFVELVHTCIEEWPLPEPGDGAARRADAQLRIAMDGLLLGPTWVALDMPMYEREGSQYAVRSASIFEALDAQCEGVSSERAWPHADQAVLRAAWALMHKAGMVERDDARVRWSKLGKIHRPIAAPYAGLPASYLRSYALLDELLFNDPDPLGIDRDGHIDRVMNVYASSGAGSGPASKEISTKIIRRLFDETPLDRQPAGIADMGCGDGSALRRLTEYVLRSTMRGRRLAEYPLFVVGADYNESARGRAADTLSVFNGAPGVHVRIVEADVSDPDRYEAMLAAAGLRVRGADGGYRPAGLADLLHTFMFLIHNRRLTVRRPDVAGAILERQLRRVDRTRLRRVIDDCFAGRLTMSSHEELPMTMDDIKAAFRVAYSDADGLVPGYVAAADLIELVARWKPYARHGFLVVEGHSPVADDLLEAAHEVTGSWMRTEQLPSVFNWGMHFVSRQFMAPFAEFRLAMCLAGLTPRDEIYGRIHPEGFPSPDLLSEYRFFSIADYVPAAPS